jgi:hypothetical protein
MEREAADIEMKKKKEEREAEYQRIQAQREKDLKEQ